MRDRVMRLAWLPVLLLTAAGAAAFFTLADLSPQVGRNFFFGSDNPAFQDTQRIRERFKTGGGQVVIAARGNIATEAYFESIAALSEELAAMAAVDQVQSLSQGPGSYEDAKESPLWRRLLLGSQDDVTLVIAMVDRDTDTRALAAQIEALLSRHEAPGFDLYVSGPPYVTEKIRRNLIRDLKIFSASALGLFALAITLLFRSPKITLGAIATCLAAVVGCLGVMRLAGIPMGILTANLATIVFVLTLSHIVFLTANWKRLYSEARGESDAVLRATGITFGASFWCMVTTLLGFLSLLFVPAAPLRQLGAGGSIGTVAAIACAYLLYPAYLGWAGRRAAQRPIRLIPDGLGRLLARPRRAPAAVLVVIALGLGVGLPRMNTDPSLLAYFQEGGEVHRGLEMIDRNGGSSPLMIVAEAKPNGPLAQGEDEDGTLDDKASYEALWRLQERIAEQPSVGSLISLPVLLAEADSKPLTFLLSWDWMVDILSTDAFGEVARGFITEDRKQVLFVARMKEAQRDRPRTKILEELRALDDQGAVRISLLGGIYYLQGKLAALVEDSLVRGLAALVGLFFLVALAVARSLPVAAAMTLSLALIPVMLLGGQGWLGVPVDIISAPASNVAIGMAADSLIHLTAAERRRRRSGAGAAAWPDALGEQGRAVVMTTGVVAAGFAIFGLSAFPPTQRFGLTVAAGCVLAAVLALLVLPILARALSGHFARPAPQKAPRNAPA